VFDTNRDGFIDKKELMNVLKYTNKRNMTVDQIDQVSTILIGGETKNGKMDFESFRKLMLESSSSSKLIL
jgi:Ca2+-binding EF-hand superfamily protein